MPDGGQVTTQASLHALLTCLDRLAEPAAAQVDYLTKLGVAGLADEIALEFDDLYRPLEGVLERLSPGCAAACRVVDRALANKNLGWSVDDLDTPEWERVREYASVASTALRGHLASGR